MPRAKGGFKTRRRRNKFLKRAKGFYSRNKSCITFAREMTDRALQYEYRDRRNRKREFRKLWTIRINAAARELGTTYSQLIHGLRTANINIDRKTLADLAVRDSKAFGDVVHKAMSSVKA